MLVHSVDHPTLAPFTMPERFRTEIVYFMTPPGERTAPRELGPKEYWIDPDAVRRWLDEGVIYLVSPLDAAAKAEIELSEEHEAWLTWLKDHHIRHVRVA